MLPISDILFWNTFTYLAGLLNLLGREFHLIGKSLTNAYQFPRFIWILLDPYFEILLINEEALMEASGRAPRAVGFLSLAEPCHSGSRFQRSYLAFQCFDNDFFAGQAILFLPRRISSPPETVKTARSYERSMASVV